MLPIFCHPYDQLRDIFLTIAENEAQLCSKKVKVLLKVITTGYIASTDSHTVPTRNEIHIATLLAAIQFSNARLDLNLCNNHDVPMRKNIDLHYLSVITKFEGILGEILLTLF